MEEMLGGRLIPTDGRIAAIPAETDDRAEFDEPWRDRKDGRIKGGSYAAIESLRAEEESALLVTEMTLLFRLRRSSRLDDSANARTIAVDEEGPSSTPIVLVVPENKNDEDEEDEDEDGSGGGAGEDDLSPRQSSLISLILKQD